MYFGDIFSGYEYEHPQICHLWYVYPKHKCAQSIVNGNWEHWGETDGIVSWLQAINVHEVYLKTLAEWLIARHTNFI